MNQTKSNLWVSATILANIIIVGIIYTIIIRLVSAYATITISPVVSLILGIIVVIFSIWLGVKSVLKVTKVDQKNLMKVSAVIVVLLVIFQVGLIIFVSALQGIESVSIFPVIYFALYDLVIFFGINLFFRKLQRQ